MPRTLSADFLAAIESSGVRPAIFVEANFTSGPLYAWTGLGSIDWNGHTWLGVGSLGSISTIEEGADVNAKGITIGLSGIDPTILTGVVSEFRTGLPVTVYFGLFDADMTLIADPVISFQGRMDQPTLNVDGQSASISINCENRLLDMNVSVERRYTNEDQQLDYPGDRGFEFVNSIQEVAVNWGRTPSTTG